MPLMGPETDRGIIGLPANCLKEETKLDPLSPLCYPNSFLAELHPEATEPDFR